MTTYFTSDPHVGHMRMTIARGFETTDEHDAWLYDLFMSTLRKHDTVWWLGDLCVTGPEKALALIGSLPGTHHLIWGNHDQGHSKHRNAHTKQRQYLEVFDSVAMSARRRIDGRDVLLSHYPYTTFDGHADHPDADGNPQIRDTQWRLPDEGHWLLHGHTHMPDQKVHGRQLHVGLDAWRRPVSLDEVAAIIRDTEEDS